MRRLDIERIVRKGADSLAESLFYYWPVDEKKEMLEANITLHLGRAFLDHGFLGYAEAVPSNKTMPHMDLLAIHPSDGTVVICQFKLLQNDAQVLDLVSDIRKAREFTLQPQPWRENWLPKGHVYCVVAGSTWKPQYAAYFDDDDAEGNEALKELRKQVEQKPGKYDWGSRELTTEGTREKNHKRQWLLYAVFKVNRDVRP